MSQADPQGQGAQAGQGQAVAPVKKVAVIAVHGVGRHAAGETQNAMADLLLSLPANQYEEGRYYRAFRSVNLRLPLQPLKTGMCVLREKQTAWSRIVSAFQERSADFAQGLKDQSERPAGKIATEYTDLLVERYEGGADSNFYETNRLEGGRLDGTADVHIYEVLWSDLSKPDSSILTFFVRLFQLLLQLASLSRLALDSGAAEAKGPLWTLQRWFQRWAVRILQMFIPLLEILLFLAVTSCLPSTVEATKGNSLLPIILGGLLMHVPFVGLIVSGKWKFRAGWFAWVVLAMVPGAVGSGLVWFLLDQFKVSADAATAVLWWLVPGGALLYWILSNYKNIRKGVQLAGWAMFGVCLVSFGIALFIAFRHAFCHPVAQAAYWVSEALLALVRLSWGILILFALAASLLGSVGWRRLKKDTPQRARAKAAVRTSRLAFALPSVLFMLVTLLLWDGFIHLAETETKHPVLTSQLQPFPAASKLQQWFLLPTPEQAAKPEAPVLPPPPGWSKPCSQPAKPGAGALQPVTPCISSTSLSGVENDASSILAWSVGYQLPLSLVLVGVAAFLMVWWALPSVLTEDFPYRPKMDGSGESPEPPRSLSDVKSLHMGTWLSRGLDATSLVTALLWCAIFAVPFAYIFVNLHWVQHALPGCLAPLLCRALAWLQQSTQELVVSYAALATAILAGLAKGGQTVLSIVLDVDTYLSGLPDEATPRAKIFERYASTLRYVNSQGYTSVVIAAHSLGALISGDILHYMHWKNPTNEPSDVVDSIHQNTQLFTFGNPTRQLLNRFFPYLYDWVRSKPDNALTPLPEPSQQRDIDPIPDADRPYPQDLGVTYWASAYRSGDYVGRSLWLNEWYERGAGTMPAIIRSPRNDRAEACIGAGAHTHYMDDTAPDMAEMLDSLIRTGAI